uniref:DUF4939 domain-containing protein n=1 Tax=Sphaeramia orbicularis TaxID=375764 RepID=A0A673C1Q4_9TELE
VQRKRQVEKPQTSEKLNMKRKVRNLPNIPAPSKYSGNPDTCRDFFTQLQLIFASQPVRFAKDSVKIAYVASLLEGPPLSYFNALFEQDSPAVQSFSALVSELKRVYDHPEEDKDF